MRNAPFRLLILGGTAEGAGLAQAVAARWPERIALTSALAGRTVEPGLLPGRVHSGGFGGADGLAAYLAAQQMDALIDATHPFALRISQAARVAARLAGVPCLVVQRPAWQKTDQDHWIEVADALAAAAMVRQRGGNRIFLTLGSSLAALQPFAGLAAFLLIRTIDGRLPALSFADSGADYAITAGRGPFSLAAERELLQNYQIDHLVTKASGGQEVFAKILAARQLGLPVVMIARPPPRAEGQAVDADIVSDITAALDWIARLI